MGTKKARGDRCLNCETPLAAEFCPSCGQRNTSYRVSVWLLLKEILSEVFELDGRVARTIVPFLFRPGYLTREFNTGRRAHYTSPFRLFLASTMAFVLVVFVGLQSADWEELAPEGGTTISVGTSGATKDKLETDRADIPFEGKLGDAIYERVLQFNALSEAEKARAIGEAFQETVPKVTLLLLPVFALLMKLLFLGTRRFYAEHLVFALHIHAFVIFAFALGATIHDIALGILMLLVVPLYLFLALRNAYGARWWTTTLRFLVLGVVYTLLFCIVGLFSTMASAVW